MELVDKLKSKIISTYRKFGNDKAVVIREKRSYTGQEMAEEIEKETEFGVKMIENLLLLTIDLISRDKINIELPDKESDVLFQYDSIIEIIDQQIDVYKKRNALEVVSYSPNSGAYLALKQLKEIIIKFKIKWKKNI